MKGLKYCRGHDILLCPEHASLGCFDPDCKLVDDHIETDHTEYGPTFCSACSNVLGLADLQIERQRVI